MRLWRPNRNENHHNLVIKMSNCSKMKPITVILLLCTVLGAQAISALKMSVSIPELVKLNDAFWLNCSYHNQQTGSISLAQDHQRQQSKSMADDIYAIKWYKDDEEFYRFLPNAHPKVSIYETNGIQLDQTKSHQGNVMINKADVNSEGNYRCEILSEAPLFETVRKSKLLKVYALPVRGPRIEILDSSGKPKSPKAQEISYAVGDKIELRCNSAPSKPAARLRWYLNEHELTVPAGNSSSRLRRLAITSGNGNQAAPLGYDVRVTPIEYRQHYKGIYSSHSTLSLVLQQDDLINNKISFKCLASMRQEVPLKSKQLIVLMPQAAPLATSGALTNSWSRLSRTRRSSSKAIEADMQATFVGQSPDSEAHVHHHRQRPQHHRHSVSRLPSSSQQTSGSRPANSLDQISANSWLQDSSPAMAYIYEDSDSTLGASIIERLESLESYLRLRSSNETHPDGGQNVDLHNSSSGNINLPTDFNRADNLEYVQLLRERLSRSQQQQKIVSQTNGGSSLHNLKRFQANSLVRSPLNLDEFDPMRPIISWPPLDSGKLVLLAPGHTLVAIPTMTGHQQNNWQARPTSWPNSEKRFILPPGDSISGDSLIGAQRQRFGGELGGELQMQSIMLERLINSLNCTCTEGSVDTRLNWLVNETPLDARDLRLYPTRVSPDHRQTWITVGLQPTMAASTTTTHDSISSLQTILAQYYSSKGGSETTSGSFRPTNRASPELRSTDSGNNQQMDLSNNQIKLACQAVHSMLLYSSSEMITFDFNPPPPVIDNNNSIEKMSSSPSNVIQATSASQSSSAPTGGTLDLLIVDSLSLRSQTTIIVFIISIIVFSISRHPSRNYRHNNLVSHRWPHC